MSELSPPPFSVLSDHASAIAAALADPDEAEHVVDSVMNWVAADPQRIAAAPIALTVDRCIAGSLQSGRPPGSGNGGPLALAMASAPTAARVVVGLHRICGHDLDETARLALRGTDDVRRLLDLVATTGESPRSATEVPPPAPAPAPAPVPPPPPAPESIASPPPLPPIPPSEPPARSQPRAPRMVRLSTVVILMILFGIVWVITRGGGQRPSFADTGSSTLPDAQSITAGRGCGLSTSLAIGSPTARTVRFGSLDRAYRVYIPTRYQQNQRLPLVIDLGDFGQTAQEREATSGWIGLAEQENLIVITAEAQGTLPQWNVAQSPTEVDDIGYISATIDAVADQACIDPARVWVTGFGSGSMMSSVFACARSAQVSAVVAVGGMMTPLSCEMDRAVSLLAIQRADDDVFPLNGGVGPGLDQLTQDRTGLTAASRIDPVAVAQGVSDWASIAGCQPGSATDGTDPTRTIYSGCRDDAVVELQIFGTGGHAWTADEAAAAFGFLRQHVRPDS